MYNNSSHRDEFYAFLTNVFHLYPEDKLHELIYKLNQQELVDQSIYKKLQDNLPDLKPLFADLTYAIPALSKQKKIIAEQTSQLVDSNKRYDGYLEVGSTGRYLDSLEETLDIKGDTFFLTDKRATYSPIDIVDRGQIAKAGKDIDLENYNSNLNNYIPNKSIDLATVYIGFHHCPLDLREEFITSIRDTMKDDAPLILRDHDAHNEKMSRMVALAHDVFNMGTNETWTYNDDELRNFYSLAELEAMMNQFGFKSDSRKIYQKGDPTLNALMVFRKS
ncbi:hypothetical protein A9Q79_02690 [Methylophaga sp. 42_25_T18]|nr:hypothetical protein A9Q79_02690 [Methylophaga sp. 42_25_T18]